MSTKKALRRLLLWFSLAVLFNIGVYIFAGKEKALQFLGGYIIEQSLSLDNLFLFLLIFESFGIPSVYQKRVLTFGIIGAVILRFIFIMLGVTVVNRFSWVLYIFGGILILSGMNMLFENEKINNFNDSGVINLLSKIMPVSNTLNGEKFFVRQNKFIYATPLFAILLLIETSDIVFAIDSIPAIFSITTDVLIVYTSNIFAILGLRNLYFILEKLHNSFRFVRYGVALILVFTGTKLLLLFFKIEIPLLLSLMIIFSLLSFSILFSLLFKDKNHTIKHFQNY